MVIVFVENRGNSMRQAVWILLYVIVRRRSRVAEREKQTSLFNEQEKKKPPQKPFGI